MENELLTHGSAAVAVVYVLEVLKRLARLPFITQHTKVVNRWASLAAAFVVSVGITVTGDAATGWTVVIPPAATLLALGVDWFHQIATQQFVYKVMYGRSDVRVTLHPPSGLPATDVSGHALSGL